MFAALLGYNPVGHLLAPSRTLARLPRHNVAVLSGKQFFPHVISGPFHHGLIIVFTAAAVMSLLGAVISLLRGKQFYYDGTDDGGLPRSPAAAFVPAPDPMSPNGHGPARRPDAGRSGRNPPAAESA
jgi:hypothetical protein